MIELFAPCLPPNSTAQHKGVKRTRKTARNPRGLVFFRKAETETTRALYSAALAPYRPEAPLTGPLRLMVGLIFPHLKSASKRLVAEQRFAWHTGRPDFDNATKELLDVLQASRFYLNDSQITAGLLIKLRGPPSCAGLYVRLAPMPPTEESPAVARMRQVIARRQADHPPPPGDCVVCHFRHGRTIPVRPGEVCGFCGTPAPGEPAPPILPAPLEIIDDFGPVDPDELFPEG